MFWRFLTAIIVLFWAVMTGLIIRDTYFPDHSRFAAVPVSMVFDLFLSEAAAFNNTLHLYHLDEKIGHASFVIREVSDDVEEPLYAFLATGSVSVPVEKQKVNATFRLGGSLLRAEQWQSFEFEFKAPAAQTEATIAWKQGGKLPKIEVKKGGQVVMNTQMAQTMLDVSAGMAGKSDWLAKMLPAGVLPEASAMLLQAREGTMELAGKRRRCYVVTLSPMKGVEMRMYFTEIGELARIELPQDYRLIEPMMHGLEPGMNTLE
jgi:hypothetical protein